MTKKILILMCHPRKDSLSSSIGLEYKRGAEEARAEVRYRNLIDLGLNPDFNEKDFRDNKKIPDKVSKSCQDDIDWAEHIVFTYPVWWGTYPAILKGYLDKVLMAGYAYRYKSKFIIEKLLKGKSARIIQTSGGPLWAAKLLFGSLFYVYPGEKAIKEVTLNFCGISPVKFTRFGDIRHSTPKERLDKILEKSYKLGQKMK